jgi:aerobic carbon-monoxide dehydrogenase small subunit
LKQSNKQIILFHINGEIRNVEIRPADTLLYILRKELARTGPKPGCLNGDCGACTVLIDHTPMKSCIMLAIETVGHKITTIEGLTDTPIQKAFVENFAFQCGYCTPGFIMNCHGLVLNHKNPSEETIKEWLSSNICRCTSYHEIELAVHSVLNNQPSSDGENK